MIKFFKIVIVCCLGLNAGEKLSSAQIKERARETLASYDMTEKKRQLVDAINGLKNISSNSFTHQKPDITAEEIPTWVYDDEKYPELSVECIKELLKVKEWITNEQLNHVQEYILIDFDFVKKQRLRLYNIKTQSKSREIKKLSKKFKQDKDFDESHY